MPNRIIRDGILSSEKVDLLSEPEELFFRRLMSVVDDYGKYSANPKLLLSACYPLRTTTKTLEEISLYLAACEHAGLLKIYKIKGTSFLELIDFRQRLRTMVSKWPGINGQTTDACLTDGSQLTNNGPTDDGSRARNPNSGKSSRILGSRGKNARAENHVTLAEPDFNALQETHAQLDIILEYDRAREKLGKEPPLEYFKQWLIREEAKLIPGAPAASRAGPAFTPPTKEEVGDYAVTRKLTRSFGFYCWKLWTGNNWKHYGEPIRSDEQWQALMETIEYKP